MRITDYEGFGGCLDDSAYIRFGCISTDREECQKIMDYCRNGINFNMIGMPNITKVIFNKPATIVLWEDGTKTVVKCSDRDLWNPEKGLAMCIVKKIFGSSYHEIFKKWIPEDKSRKSYFPGYLFKNSSKFEWAKPAWESASKAAKDIFESNWDILQKKSEIEWFKYIEYGQEIYECSGCGHVQKTETNYCPNCGGKAWKIKKED